MTASSLRVVDAFRDQLLVAPTPVRRRRAPLAMAAALVAAVAASLSFALGGDRAAPALAVERSGDVVSIRLHDATAAPWELTKELQAAGLKAFVLVAPATPDAVGTWVEVKAPRFATPGQDLSAHDAYDEHAERRRAAERLRGVEVRGDVVHVPAGYPHHLVLIAGAPTRAGQAPIYDTDGRLPLAR